MYLVYVDLCVLSIDGSISATAKTTAKFNNSSFVCAYSNDAVTYTYTYIHIHIHIYIHIRYK